MAFGKKKKQKNSPQPSSVKVDIRNNPFYPKRSESLIKEIGSTIGVVVVCLLLAGAIIKNFNYMTIADRQTSKADGEQYTSESADSNDVPEDSISGYEDEKLPEGVEQENISDETVVTNDTVVSDVKSLNLLPGDPEEPMTAYTYIPVVAANATSTITQEGTDNSPILLFDGRDDTSWQEGVDGYGIGECLRFSFDGTHQVKYIAVKLGNWKNDKYYFGNARPKTVTLVLGDFASQVTFTGERRVEWIKLDGEVVADSMSLTIDDIYVGTDWDDTCITEIALYGN